MTKAVLKPRLVLPDQSGRVAVVAGNGALPGEALDGLVRQGLRPLIVAIEGEADIMPDPARFDFLSVRHEDLGRLPAMLKRNKVTHLILAGGVERRPALTSLRFSPKVLLQLPLLIAAYARGDDGLLRGLARIVASYGIRLIGVHEVIPEILAQEGVAGKVSPRKSDLRNISAGIEAARAIGRLDIGQAAIAVGGRAIALEDIEGTDGLMQRAIAMQSHGRLAGKTGGALVKCAKPGQELRIDLPSIGPQTMHDAHAAGLAGVALEAGRSLILESAETIRLADEYGLFLFGFEQGREE